MTFNDNASLDTSQVTSGGRGGGMRPGGVAVGGGGGLILVLLLVLSQCMGGGGGGGTGGPWNLNASNISTLGEAQGQTTDFSHCKTGADANKHDDCRVIGTVNSLNDFWPTQFKEGSYKPAKTVIYEGSVNTGCGAASSEVGPFYCPLDSQAYIDVSFFKQLDRLSGERGLSEAPLAKEYIIAHEYGHHIQNLTGALSQAQKDPKGPESGAVRVELQADCYAGAWIRKASTTKDKDGNTLLQPITAEQLKTAQRAAQAVGDDHIMEKTQGRVTPENFTHGTSAQREKWLLAGFEGDDPGTVCDTFSTDNLG